MPKETTDPWTDDRGDEHHPAFGLIGMNRVHSTPGAVLFQSDIRHPEYIVIRLHEAVRKRDLKHDWVHAQKLLFEVSLSLSQFASFVSSAGQGDGVPCTIEWTGTGSEEPGDRPGLKPAPRLALSHGEVRAAANEAFGDIQEALQAYEAALDEKAPAAVRKAALNKLRASVSNAAPNVAYAAKKLDEHAEQVVETSRADIEAMAFRTAERLGIPISEIQAIEEGTSE